MRLAKPNEQTEVIRTTGFHKFYFPATDAWVSANTLKPGDALQGANAEPYLPFNTCRIRSNSRDGLAGFAHIAVYC